MPAVSCPTPDCMFVTDDVDASIAAVLLTIHNNMHTTPTAGASPGEGRQRAPKIDRPTIAKSSTEENWNSFLARWEMFKRGTRLMPGEIVQHLFQCCEEELGNDILQSHPDSTRGDESNLLSAIKRLAVIPVAVSVRRSDLLSIRQDHGENVRSFYARISGKAATCAYFIDCPSTTCNQQVNFTDIIAKDVLISGLIDDEIRKDVLGWSELDNKTLKDTITFIESKEMARDALSKQSISASISTSTSTKTKCKNCKIEIGKQVWNKRQRKMITVTHCLSCWRKANPRAKNQYIGTDLSHRDVPAEANTITIASSINHQSSKCRPILLDHHIFTKTGWKEADSMLHPTIQLHLTVDKEDYHHLDINAPNVAPTNVTAVTDTGAQSCLWSQKDFHRCGFKDSDLLPVKRTLIAANKEKININGAIFVRLSGSDSKGITHIAPVMVYVSPDTHNFYLSRDSLIQLQIIPKNFPRVGAAATVSVIEHPRSPCGCPTRTLPPERPKCLPFEATPVNNFKMKEWLTHRYSASTFNKCLHQQLPGMTGPEIRLHVDPNAEPVAAHTPAPVPLHWQDEVKLQIDNDVSLGVLEKVPIGEPSFWCHRMVLVRKADGTPRRTVDLSPLNQHCLRETHHVKPPFQQAKTIPPMTWKTITDAWNGYHSVRINTEDRHLTTFITPWGRYRYKTAPQGFLASGDGYTRRFDEIIKDVPRKTKCVDDTAMWDTELEEHWWRVIDFLDLLGRNGIVLNVKKFQFAQREVDFAGFKVTENEIQPLDKFIAAIRDFPTPTKLGDIRSWFGLVNQVSHYGQLTDLMLPFKPLLSPRAKFNWSQELETAFRLSKSAIITAIKDGVEIFDITKRTCLRPDWSKTGIGFYMSQKHCSCESTTPDCCRNGWRITLAGSRFLKPAETRYAPVEGEALAIAWSLEQTRFFTQGCDNLLVVTDHKPLTKLFGNRSLDAIANPRLFRLKQRTLLWRFDIMHMPGVSNHFSDATSRHPVSTPSDANDEDMESDLASIFISEIDHIKAVTWDVVKKVTSADDASVMLKEIILTGFPTSRNDLDTSLQPYWEHRANLWTLDNVIMMKDRIVIPLPLRNEVLQTLHAAHQGTTSMNERAKSVVFWPGISVDIQKVRAECNSCNKNAPSQARPPPIEPWIPATPFEAIACDYFHFRGWYYFVAADRLSGWTEQSRIKAENNNTGSSGLCKAFRTLFSTFGVPIEISSDGGPEFTAMQTKEFFQRWGVRHRLSSAYHPSSNGRAELAVKATKRLLMENIGPSGDLNTDKMVRALLTQRNTPDPTCKLSPAQILFGRPLRDTLPYINKSFMSFTNPQISSQWQEMWKLKEETMRDRYSNTLATLYDHSRPLIPLKTGDQVFIQNQTGTSPRKWDRNGTVMEVKNNDQYLIKVAGTGRLTLRNRRFLRKIKHNALKPPDHHSSTLMKSQPSAPMSKASTSKINLRSTDATFKPTDIPLSEDVTIPPLVTKLPTSNRDPEPSFNPQNGDDISSQPGALVDGTSPPADPVPNAPNVDSPQLHTDAHPIDDLHLPRRSTRTRKPRQFYDPETGKYTDQNP